MLISKNQFDSGDIVTFKLVNGDEIVAKVLEDNGMSYIIERPCTVVPSHQGIGLVQSLFTADVKKTMPLSKQHVMMAALSIKEMANHYFQTTTGIQPVTAGSIVT